MEQQTKQLSDYLDAFRRRWLSILIIGGVILSIGGGLAFLLPPVFRSEATILIEAQEIPFDLVRTTITSFATQRIQITSQRVMSRVKLMEIIEEFNLYEKDRKRKTTEQIVAKMRQDISLEMISADVMDRGGRPVQAAIAFMLAFESESPVAAQKVTNELVSLYLSENLKVRTEQAAETYNFLEAEAKRLGLKLSQIEDRLARFQEANRDSLPTITGTNLQLMQRVESDLSDTELTISFSEDRLDYLRSQLALTPEFAEGRGGSGDQMPTSLPALRDLRIVLLGRYVPTHPDVLQVERQIAALEAERANPGGQDGEVARLSRELAIAQQKYSDDHPDVVRLKRELENAEVAAASSSLEPIAGDAPQTQDTADNPVYIALKEQISQLELRLDNARQRRQQLRAKVDEYERRLLEAPEVERQYFELTRDRANTLEKYQDIRSKQLEAEVAQELERGQKAEKFELIDPPLLPREPVSPNRPAIIFMSLVLALGVGFGSAVLAESIDTSVRGSRGVMHLFGTAPLATIPYQENRADRTRKKRATLIVFALFIATIALAVTMVHFLWAPLDVLWYRGLRNLDIPFG